MAGGGESKKAIYAALFGNLAIAISKLFAALFTGSTSMWAETYHSFSDTFNQVLLLVGVKISKKVGARSTSRRPTSSPRNCRCTSFSRRRRRHARLRVQPSGQSRTTWSASRPPATWTRLASRCRTRRSTRSSATPTRLRKRSKKATARPRCGSDPADPRGKRPTTYPRGYTSGRFSPLVAVVGACCGGDGLGSARQGAADDRRHDDSRSRRQGVCARHVALRLPARPRVHDRLGDFVGRRDDPAGVRLVDELLLRKALGGDEAGEDHAHVHAVLALFEVERIRPPGEGELRSRVGAGVRARHAACSRGDVHDRAWCRAPEDGEEGLGQPRDRFEVELHVALEVLPAGVAELAAPRRACVVHQQVEPAVLGLDLLCDHRRRILVGQVHGDHGCATDFGGEGIEAVLPARDQDELCPGLACDPLGCRLTDAARSACHECDHGPEAIRRGT